MKPILQPTDRQEVRWFRVNSRFVGIMECRAIYYHYEPDHPWGKTGLAFAPFQAQWSLEERAVYGTGDTYWKPIGRTGGQLLGFNEYAFETFEAAKQWLIKIIVQRVKTARRDLAIANSQRQTLIQATYSPSEKEEHG